MIKPYITTGIGSLPFHDPEAAAEFVLTHCDIPFWPQLPAISFRELMIPQYSEGFPGIMIDDEKRVIVADPDQSSLNRFYESTSSGEQFPLFREFARGFYSFIEHIQDKKFPLLKGQITGPLTFTLGLKTPDGRPVFFNEELREIGSILLRKKAEWQIKTLSLYAERVIIFIDEPILTAIGSSSYLGVEEDEVKRLLRDTVSSISSAGGISGIHCCGKADWSMVIGTGVDIINFDAYDYFDSLSIYGREIRDFISKGGELAWGIVPTTDAIRDISLNALEETIKSQVLLMSEKTGIDNLPQQVILTPSCGAGSRSPEEAEKVFSLLKSLSEDMTR